MKLFLIGFMGVGKSTLAKSLADQYKLPFVDLDQYIEDQERMRIADIFKRRGVRKFRQIERDALSEVIATNEEFVLASGGGTPAHYNNLQLMKKSGTTVFLDLPWNELVIRLEFLAKNEKSRPLLQKTDQKAWFDLYKKREPKYRQAHIVCDLSADDHLDLLTKQVDLLTKA